MSSSGSPSRLEAMFNSPYVRLLRPRQWIKNSFVLVGLLFGGHMGEFHCYLPVGVVFVLICAASSAVYVFNDIVDRERDRLHPVKCLRPIPSGQISVRQASGISLALAALALLGSAWLHTGTLICILLYLLNNILYSLWLKDHPLLDVLSIASGFILRMLAGVYILGDLPTSWILLCTFFLTLFLGIAKRRAELATVSIQGHRQRAVLGKYSMPFLDILLGATGVMTMVSYALFTALGGKSHAQILTLPFVFYAVFHYLRLVLVHNYGEDPAEVLLKDPRLIVIIMIWLAFYLAIEQWNPVLFR
ncbi:MAG: UbiA prenyltransferase family protein [Magnetococcales bacterium]|nr:UbiA prenyltransferase family protein [Magnetococcales bacterium]MBF0322378.1 UbiA prenyltransferase family protein [Magnetococcales bacterium]